MRVYRIRSTMQRLTWLFTTDRQHSPPFPDPEVLLSLRRVIAREKPEIVHAHNWIIHSFLPLKEWSRARLVMTLHDCELACAQMRMMYLDTELCSGPAFARCIRCAAHHYGPVKGTVTLLGNWSLSGLERSLVDMFLPVSYAVARANRLTGARTPFLVVPNFVPDDVAEASDDADPRMAQLPSEGFILQVGDLVRDKGIGVLLEAYAGLPSAPPLVLIGRRFAGSPRDLPLNVTVVEGLPHALVMHAWRRSLFGTVPSMCLDACPTVTMEAMASGRPVIGSHIGGIMDQIVDGETGLLVPPGDMEALRQAMARLLADPGLRARMGEAAKRKVVEFQASAVVSKIEAVYLSLTQVKRAALTVEHDVPSNHLADAQIKAHYEVEKELANRLRRADKEERGLLYTTVYNELFRRVPYHSQLARKADATAQAMEVARQFGLLKHFLNPNTTYLEIGAGDCGLAFKVAGQVKQVYAVDVSDEITKSATQPANFSLIISDGSSIPVPAESVQVAYSQDLMEHLHPDDVLEQLGNIYRALAHGGIYICITPNRLCGPHDISRYFDEVATGFHLKEYTNTELAALFKQVGFTQVWVVLSYKGRVLSPLLPSTPFVWLESLLQKLPRSLRRKLAQSLIAVKLVARK